VFIRFAKRQQEETAHVAGVVYAEDEETDDDNSSASIGEAGASGGPSDKGLAESISNSNCSSSSDTSVPTGFYSRSGSRYSSSSSPNSPSSSAAETNPLLSSTQRASSTRQQPFSPLHSEPADASFSSTGGPHATVDESLDPSGGAAGDGGRGSRTHVEML